jgi:hypothetical protein
MQITLTYRSMFIVAIAIAAGCNTQDSTSTKEIPVSAAPPKNTSVASASVNSWLGQWIGPKGTSLTLIASEEGYSLTIQSLDGPAQYIAKAVDDHIEFTRNGKTESIRATDGKGTGMKWLQEKTNCLTIQVSEGFCRD